MATKTTKSFSAEERDAMKERALEAKKPAKRGKGDGEADILAKIAEMSAGDKALAERIHALVRAAAPELECKTWYGMPAYARDGKVVVFFQNSEKFKVRYCTLGFQEDAKLDEGNIWPNSYAITKLTKADEATITALIKRAIG